MEKFTKITHAPLLNSHDVEQKRQEILNYFSNTYDLYEQLFLNLTNAAYYHRADPLRYPLIFYLGHTAVFYINKLLLVNLIPQGINPKFEKLLAVGVDEQSWDDLDETHYQWPTIAELIDYRNQAKVVVTKVIQEYPFTLPINWEDPFWAILMGIEHERLHLETSTLLIRQLPLNLLHPQSFWASCPEAGSAPLNQLLPVHAQQFIVGKTPDYPLYGWDNEYGEEQENVDLFYASQYLVSNQEFLSFVEEGGYQESRWWTEEGWRWKTYQQAMCPRFWLQENNEYFLRNMLEVIPMPWNWPVEVNELEAKAFCNWLAARSQQNVHLPTEAQWYALHNLMTKQYPSNINLEQYMSPCPVNKFKMENFYDITGNVWQWTETTFSGFLGFHTHPLYPDFSYPTFDNKHNLIKGGAWISTGTGMMHHFRVAFRRHFYQYAGFRYVV